MSTAATTDAKGSLHYNRSTNNLVATQHVIVTRPELPVHNPLSRSLDHTHTQTSIVVHLIAQYSHCLTQHLRLTPGKYTVLSPTLCGANRIRRLGSFRPERAPLGSNSRGSSCILVPGPVARFAALAANLGPAPATILARGHIRRRVRHQQLMHFTWRFMTPFKLYHW